MTVTYDPSIPGDAEFGFSYEYGCDILLPPVAPATDPVWQAIRRVTGVDPQVQPKTQDAATYDDRGSDNAPKVGENWTLAFQVQVQRLPTGLYLPEVEALMALNAPDAVGEKATGTFRWYDKPRSGPGNPLDAFEGDGSVSIGRGQTGNDGIGSWTVTVTGRGPRRQIDNPHAGWVTPAPTDPAA